MGIVNTCLKQEILAYLTRTRTALPVGEFAKLFRVSDVKIRAALSVLCADKLVEQVAIRSPTGDTRTRPITAYKAWDIGTRVDGARAILRAAMGETDANGEEPG